MSYDTTQPNLPDTLNKYFNDICTTYLVNTESVAVRQTGLNTFPPKPCDGKTNGAVSYAKNFGT